MAGGGKTWNRASDQIDDLAYKRMIFGTNSMSFAVLTVLTFIVIFSTLKDLL
jgi:hypothetical protein